MIHDVLSSALRRATEALGGDDAIAAAEALKEAAAACDSAVRRGLRLEEGTLITLRPLHDQCIAAATGAHDRLRATMNAAGIARRALGAYHR